MVTLLNGTLLMQYPLPNVSKESNRLLAALPHADWVRWMPHLDLVEFEVG